MNFFRDKRRDVCRIFGLGLFCTSLAFALREAPRSGAPADAPNPPASRIYIDPATGERGAPPAGVAEEPLLKAPAVPLAALRAETRADGTVGVHLHGHFRSYSVATVSPDGSLTQDCFRDAEAAAAAVRTGTARGNAETSR